MDLWLGQNSLEMSQKVKFSIRLLALDQNIFLWSHTCLGPIETYPAVTYAADEHQGCLF